MQAYFLDRMDAGDMLAIKELVRFFCQNYAKVLLGDMPINAILPCEPSDYLESAMVVDKPLVIKIFFDDIAFIKDELKDIRKISNST